jgi:putative sterol carrier protein
MDFDEIKQKIQTKLDRGTTLKSRICFDFGDDGALLIDTKSDPYTLTAERSDDVDLTLTTSLAVFSEILNGTQDPNLAFMFGKLKINGSMGLAMKLNSFLED